MTVVDTSLEALEEREQELTDAARSAIWGLWCNRSRRLAALDRNDGYRAGRRGIPEVAPGSSKEIRTLADQSVMNVCSVVVGAFARGMSVVGYRSPSAQDNEPAWAWWQSQRLDARQAEVIDAMLTHGDAYVSVLPAGEGLSAEAATWSPRNAIVEFDDPRRDALPMHAVLLRPDGDDWLGLYVDTTNVYEFTLAKAAKGARGKVDGILEAGVWTGRSWPHGAMLDGEPVCPVVPFLNERSADDVDPRGEVEPLITQQQAINSVNFDRLCASRFAAFRQKVIVGWTAPRDELARSSTSRVWTFDEDPADMDVKSLEASPIAPYNDLLREMKEQVALVASIPIHQATGSLSNVSTETVAMVDAAYQRKLALKQLSAGESWELVLTLGVTMSGGEQPDPAAEVIWMETQARSFAQVVDGIVKLATIPADARGVPVVEMLDLIPGMTQQRINAVRQSLTRSQGQAVLEAVAALAQPPAAPVAPEG